VPHGASSPMFVDCVFSGNFTTGGMGGGGFGGAVRHASTGSPTFSDCSFDVNHTGNGGLGGAVYAGDIASLFSGCVFNGNTGGLGGAVYLAGGSASVEDCAFADNTADGDSSGMYAYGGAIYMANGNHVVERTVFDGNGAATVRTRGGAVYADLGTGYSASLTNCVFRENHSPGAAYGYGGGLCTGQFGTYSVMNCTFWGNTANSAASSGGAIYMGSFPISLVNSIIWGNTPGGTNMATSSDEIHHNILQDGPLGPGDFNSGEDPVFVGGDPYDLHVSSADSPAVDDGSSTAPGVPSDDVEGTSRPIGGGYDMGAYECF
jgi:predicted outer membrane repeat protein